MLSGKLQPKWQSMEKWSFRSACTVLQPQVDIDSSDQQKQILLKDPRSRDISPTATSPTHPSPAMAPHAEEPLSQLSPAQQQPTTKKGHSSLPVPNPCLSYWHRTTRAFPYLNHNSTTPIPTSKIKYLIIGSGLAGSLTAYTLLQKGIPPPSILILEARESVSGASGRNAGHVRPDAFRGYAAYARIHGAEQARKIIENEKLVLESLAAFVTEHQISCDFQSTKTFDVCLTQEFAEYERESLQAFESAGGDISHVSFYSGEEARKVTKVKEAVAAYEWPAGSSHPAKLAQWLLRECVEKGVGLWTHCPAEKIDSHSGSDPTARWDVHTPRGTVLAENVIHCTNAYAAHLLPELATFVTPNRAQAHTFVPGRELSGEKALRSTMSLRYSLKHFFSLIQREGDGTVVFGMSRENPLLSQEYKDSIVSFDDTSYSDEAATTAATAFKTLFPDPSNARHGEGADHYWSGIIAMTPDSVPMVGAVDDKPGQFILAGFNGHGMARIWTSAPGLVDLMLSGSWPSTVPECFRYSKERIERAAKDDIKSVW
ncbi:uncharacterized protein RCC_05453 [Ramularia collo-cygni]|uniref:FAD dependent oxidoreductase domain-containing protein n=1 Tax=Ramularia collo-cygni TaxID=112498 RepID=A0A2D3UR92_9PEZI|nr:uncharacterized protein RCC_05453 [Ramularia collo-cygni]CZT19602.1 uncharacterized protein RCC_05453 [Ramularia collo-cygni]